jgi:uncharacterized membrane protein
LYHVFAFTGNGGLVKSGQWVYNTAPCAQGLTSFHPSRNLSGSIMLERKLALSLKNTELTRIATPRPRLTVIAWGLALLIIILFIQASPSTLLGKADFVGYAICHKIPERSFPLGDGHFPLCARCTGTFLGAIVGLVVMLILGRRRASRMAPVPILGILVAFIGFWGFDGVNSYLTFFPGAPNLYEPRNWLRLTTGMLNGLALIVFVFPIYNFTLWREPTQERVIKNLWELLVIMVVIVVLILAIVSGVEWALYPLAILSSLGVVVMLVVINSMIAAVVLGREGYAHTWRQALVPLTIGLALALLQITGMVALRAYLTATLGLPF